MCSSLKWDYLYKNSSKIKHQIQILLPGHNYLQRNLVDSHPHRTRLQCQVDICSFLSRDHTCLHSCSDMDCCNHCHTYPEETLTMNMRRSLSVLGWAMNMRRPLSVLGCTMNMRPLSVFGWTMNMRSLSLLVWSLT